MDQPRISALFDGAGDTTWDGVVIGAGPAGAMAARELALLGGRILLVERKRFPRWKICGACLNAHALACLRSAGLGSLVARLGGIRLDQLQVGFRNRQARLALPAGASLSRSRLDAALVEAATDAGALFMPETQANVCGLRNRLRLVRLIHRGISIDIRARVVLVAAGLGNRCQTASSAAKTEVRPGSRIGAGCLIDDAPDFYQERTIFMAVGRAGYVGTVRVEDGGLNVAAALEPAQVRCHGTPGVAAAAIILDAGFPPIAGLAHAHWQGTAGLTRHTQPLAQERLFLLGDAAGYVEPFTGEGIAWALVSAQAVAPLAQRAIERWDPQIARDWSELYRRLIGRRQLVCRAVAMGLRRPWLAAIGFEVCFRLPASAGFVVRRVNAPSSFTNASSACPF
jgi:flavin-dependent dehydrogenase